MPVATIEFLLTERPVQAEIEFENGSVLEDIIPHLGEMLILLRDGKDLSILCCGITASMALEAAEGLSEAGIEARVVNISTIKPANERNILSHARETGAFLTVETHSVNRGQMRNFARNMVYRKKPSSLQPRRSWKENLA